MTKLGLAIRCYIQWSKKQEASSKTYEDVWFSCADKLDEISLMYDVAIDDILDGLEDLTDRRNSKIGVLA